MHFPKKGPYTVAAWGFVKKEDKLTVNGIDYHWCTDDHYSGGAKHNWMYTTHKSSDHDAWCKDLGNHKAAWNPGKTSNESPTPAAASVPA